MTPAKPENTLASLPRAAFRVLVRRGYLRRAAFVLLVLLAEVVLRHKLIMEQDVTAELCVIVAWDLVGYALWFIVMEWLAKEANKREDYRKAEINWGSWLEMPVDACHSRHEKVKSKRHCSSDAQTRSATETTR